MTSDLNKTTRILREGFGVIHKKVGRAKCEMRIAECGIDKSKD